jgi:hypothetical protein
MKVLRFVRSLASLPLAIVRWSFNNVMQPSGNGDPLPPIRYDGDPRDIYLA